MNRTDATRRISNLMRQTKGESQNKAEDEYDNEHYHNGEAQ